MSENKEFERYNNKAMSVRLQDDALIFFLKYAQQVGAENITDTFKNMIDELQTYHNLDEVELRENIWPERKEYNFLKAAEKKEPIAKETLYIHPVELPKIHAPKPVEPEEENDKDDDEDVFTI